MITVATCVLIHAVLNVNHLVVAIVFLSHQKEILQDGKADETDHNDSEREIVFSRVL